MPPSLLELQRRFQAALLAGKDDVLSEIVGGTIAPVERLAIYRNNVFGALTRALRLSYPALVRLVGDDCFAAMVARFAVATPPNTADLCSYGKQLPEFLETFEPARRIAYLPDVARLEWAVNYALHAPLMDPLSANAIYAVPTSERADLCFIAHPSLSLLSFSHPVHAIWRAVLTEDKDERDERLASIDAKAGAERLAVLLSDGVLSLRDLSPSEFRFVRALIAGTTLTEALTVADAEQPALLLGSFLAQGFFSGCVPLSDTAVRRKASD